MEHNAAPPPAQSFQTATRAPLRAELIGSRRCSAVGITATGNAPVLTLCRRLIEEAYRGTTLCLRVRSIGEGARLTVHEGDGRPRFVRLTRDVGPPVAPNDLAATPLAEPLQKTPGAERADEALRHPEQLRVHAS